MAGIVGRYMRQGTALSSLTYTLMEMNGVFAGDDISDGRALRTFLWGFLLGGFGRH